MCDLTGLLDAAAAGWPDRPAVRDAGGVDSYAQLDAASRAAAAGLRAAGVGPGDRVVLYLDGGRDFARVLFGVLRAGAVAVPVGTAIGSLHLDWILRDAQPALVVADRPVTVSGLPATSAAALWTARPGAADGTGPAVAGGDNALLLYTSGSTGMPRAVVCPHARVRFVTGAIADRLRYTHTDVVFSRLPVSFDYGLYQVLLCVAAGATLVLRPDLAEARMLREARATGATVLPIVPSLGGILLRLARRDPGPSRVRMLTNTGAALHPALAGGLRAAFPGARVVPMYGMTECKRITIAEPDEDRRFPGTVGRALDGTEVVVVAADGRPVPPGEIGEILVRGPHVMAGYWRAPEATRDRFVEAPDGTPTLRTGDYGWLDEDRRLYLVGRRDDIFKRRGQRMNTQEVEAALLDVPGVAAAAVPPPGADGVLSAYVVTDLPAEEVLAAVARRVEAAKVPDRCVRVPALPTTSHGKVDRAALGRLVATPER